MASYAEDELDDDYYIEFPDEEENNEDSSWTYDPDSPHYILL